MSPAVSTKNLSLISRTKTTPRDPKITSGSISSSAGIPTDFSEYERWQGVCAGISQSVRLSSLKDSFHFYDPLTAFGGDYAFAWPTISQQLLGGRGAGRQAPQVIHIAFLLNWSQPHAGLA